MRSRTGNSLSTLMFMVPLLGVPLMAIFGVPQFVPVIASSVSDETNRPVGTRAPRQGVGESASATSIAADSSPRDLPHGEPRFADLFGSPSRLRRDSRPIREMESHGLETKFVETSLSAETWLTQSKPTEPELESAAKLHDLFGNSVTAADHPEPRNRARLAAIPSRGGLSAAARTPAGLELSGEALTWREAVRRLNELGIQDFRLEPGSQVGEFYFACEFTPHRDARVTRRFEAEATEPLLAVKAVLRQIDEWLTRR